VLTIAAQTERPPEYPSGLFDPTLCCPARGPASWRRRSVLRNHILIRAVDGRGGASIMTRGGPESARSKGCVSLGPRPTGVGEEGRRETSPLRRKWWQRFTAWIRCSRETFVTFQCRRHYERAQALSQVGWPVSGDAIPLAASHAEVEKFRSLGIRPLPAASARALRLAGHAGEFSTDPQRSVMAGGGRSDDRGTIPIRGLFQDRDRRGEVEVNPGSSPPALSSGPLRPRERAGTGCIFRLIIFGAAAKYRVWLEGRPRPLSVRSLGR
jgi:hypothetical protein